MTRAGLGWGEGRARRVDAHPSRCGHAKRRRRLGRTNRPPPAAPAPKPPARRQAECRAKGGLRTPAGQNQLSGRRRRGPWGLAEIGRGRGGVGRVRMVGGKGVDGWWGAHLERRRRLPLPRKAMPPSSPPPNCRGMSGRRRRARGQGQRGWALTGLAAAAGAPKCEAGQRLRVAAPGAGRRGAHPTRSRPPKSRGASTPECTWGGERPRHPRRRQRLRTAHAAHARARDAGPRRGSALR